MHQLALPPLPDADSAPFQRQTPFHHIKGLRVPQHTPTDSHNVAPLHGSTLPDDLCAVASERAASLLYFPRDKDADLHYTRIYLASRPRHFRGGSGLPAQSHLHHSHLALLQVSSAGHTLFCQRGSG